jgi:hypothetical protein
MAKSESEPVSEDEWLLRRVRKERVKRNRVPMIGPAAFEPRINGRDPDVDGISLFRLACLNDVMELIENIAPEKRTLQGIVRVPVALIRSLGLTIDVKPVSFVPGHVVLREINASAFANREDWLPAVLEELAKAASEPGNVLIWPEGV